MNLNYEYLLLLLRVRFQPANSIPKNNTLTLSKKQYVWQYAGNGKTGR